MHFVLSWRRLRNCDRMLATQAWIGNCRLSARHLLPTPSCSLDSEFKLKGEAAWQLTMAVPSARERFEALCMCPE